MIASLYHATAASLTMCQSLRNADDADDIVSNSTPFPNPFLSVYWHTKPGADPCTNKSGSEAIGVR